MNTYLRALVQRFATHTLSAPQDTLSVDFIIATVRKRNELMYNDAIRSLSSINDRGPFDILPLHANFVSIINDHMTVVDVRYKKHYFKVTRGLLRVRENTIEVYIGI